MIGRGDGDRVAAMALGCKGGQNQSEARVGEEGYLKAKEPSGCMRAACACVKCVRARVLVRKVDGRNGKCAGSI